MPDDEVARAVEEIERGLRARDPRFVRDFERLRRVEAASVAVAAVLLASCAAFLAAGLAARSAGWWCLAVLAFVGVLAADQRYKRALSGTGCGRGRFRPGA